MSVNVLHDRFGVTQTRGGILVLPVQCPPSVALNCSTLYPLVSVMWGPWVGPRILQYAIVKACGQSAWLILSCDVQPTKALPCCLALKTSHRMHALMFLCNVSEDHRKVGVCFHHPKHLLAPSTLLAHCGE